MKTIVSILNAILSTISIPLAISQIIDGYRVLLFSILLFFIIPGYILSLRFLYEKYDW